MSVQLQMADQLEPDSYDFTTVDLNFRKSSTPAPETWHCRLEDLERPFGKSSVMSDPLTKKPCQPSQMYQACSFVDPYLFPHLPSPSHWSEERPDNSYWEWLPWSMTLPQRGDWLITTAGPTSHGGVFPWGILDIWGKTVSGMGSYSLEVVNVSVPWTLKLQCGSWCLSSQIFRRK